VLNPRLLLAWTLLLTLFLSGCVFARGQRYESFVTKTPLAENQTLVIGFLGGRQAWDNDVEGVRQLALKLRARNIEGVHIETAENRKRALALRLVKASLDRDSDGRPSDAERASARIMLYGQSFGGAAVAKFARDLERENIPILLTVQIDSVGKDDHIIPPNVRAAANLYQREGLIRGEDEIGAADPEKTRILGNVRYTYRDKEVPLPPRLAWFKRALRSPHVKMNHDPEVWAEVEQLILAAVEGREPRLVGAANPSAAK
jgi:hypothetical protein